MGLEFFAFSVIRFYLRSINDQSMTTYHKASKVLSLNTSMPIYLYPSFLLAQMRNQPAVSEPGRQDVWEYDPVLFNGPQAEYEANRVENVARANADHNQVDDTWERVKEVGLRGLTSKRHMKIVLRWMRERQKIRLICNVVGPHKKFLYTTWFSKPSISHTSAVHNSSTSTPSFSVDTSSPKLSSG